MLQIVLEGGEWSGLMPYCELLLVLLGFLQHFSSKTFQKFRAMSECQP